MIVRYPARVQRRAAAAHRHRARAGAEPGAHHRRRSGVGARRLDPGAGRQAADGPEGEAQADLPVHRARPAAGGTHLQPRGGDVPGEGRRDGGHGARCLPTRRIPTRARSSARSRCSTPTRRVSASSSIRRHSTARRRCANSARGTGRRSETKPSSGQRAVKRAQRTRLRPALAAAPCSLTPPA